VQQNSKMLDNEEFVERMIERLIIAEFKEKQNISLTAPLVRRINGYLVREYINEYNGIAA